MDKLLVLVFFFALHGLAPGYIQDLVMPDSPNRNRRDDQRLFVVPRFTLEGFGRRAFSVSGATLRNSLPENSRHSNTLAVSILRHIRSIFSTLDPYLTLL